MPSSRRLAPCRQSDSGWAFDYGWRGATDRTEGGLLHSRRDDDPLLPSQPFQNTALAPHSQAGHCPIAPESRTQWSVDCLCAWLVATVDGVVCPVLSPLHGVL